MTITTSEAIILHKLFSNIEEQIEQQCVRLEAREGDDIIILGGVDYDNNVITITSVILNGAHSTKLTNNFQDYLNEKYF